MSSRSGPRKVLVVWLRATAAQLRSCSLPACGISAGAKTRTLLSRERKAPGESASAFRLARPKGDGRASANVSDTKVRCGPIRSARICTAHLWIISRFQPLAQALNAIRIEKHGDPASTEASMSSRPHRIDHRSAPMRLYSLLLSVENETLGCDSGVNSDARIL